MFRKLCWQENKYSRDSLKDLKSEKMKVVLRFIVCLVFCFVYEFGLFAQTDNSVQVRIVPVFDGKPIELDSVSYAIRAKDSVKFSSLRFYISAVQLFQDSSLVKSEENSFHLVDITNPESMQFLIPVTKEFNTLQFNLGLDSLVNVSGVRGGVLDPTQGMYWTWQSGYINFELTGVSPNCPEPRHAFDFHLGGYQYPFKTIQVIRSRTGQNKTILVSLEIRKFISEIDLQNKNHVMSPGADAVKLCSLLGSCFFIQ